MKFRKIQAKFNFKCKLSSVNVIQDVTIPVSRYDEVVTPEVVIIVDTSENTGITKVTILNLVRHSDTTLDILKSIEKMLKETRSIMKIYKETIDTFELIAKEYCVKLEARPNKQYTLVAVAKTLKL